MRPSRHGEPTGSRRRADRQALLYRGPKNRVDPGRPYAFLVEPERSARGRAEPVATVFLTNRECPFRCVFCDLWKNTLDQRVPVGAIPAQIDYALARLPAARHVKLYNSGNFFDAQAIPPEDWRAIAQRVARFETVIVENHPRLVGPGCAEFRDLLHRAAGAAPRRARASQCRPTLEVAMGLETIHPRVLPALNKNMSLALFSRAARRLADWQIALRAFVLLGLPGISPALYVTWAVRSLEFAFEQGARVCSVIATRFDDGALRRMAQQGTFAPPTLAQLEEALERGVALGRGRVFADLWGAEQFSACSRCGPRRIERMRRINLTQALEPPVCCDCRRA